MVFRGHACASALARRRESFCVLLIALLLIGAAPCLAQTTVSGATFAVGPIAPESIASTFGTGLADAVASASEIPLPINLAGTTVKITDSTGQEGFAPLFFVSDGQVNWLVPAWVAPGVARIEIRNPQNDVFSEDVTIERVAPGLFTANASGSGVAAAVALREKSGGARNSFSIFQCIVGRCVAAPIDLRSPDDTLVLSLFGTGIRSYQTIAAFIDDQEVPVLAAVAQPQFEGLDQVNIALPYSLGERGPVFVRLVVDGVESNAAKILLVNIAARNVEPVKIAFVSDTEGVISLNNLDDSSWTYVARLIRDEQVDMVLQQGDYWGAGGTYEQWKEVVETYLDSSSGDGVMPYLGPPVNKSFPPVLEQRFLGIANHMEENLGAEWGGCLEARKPARGDIDPGNGCSDDIGATAGDYWMRWKGVSIVFQNLERNLQWAPQVLEDDTNVWKICDWHGNHLDFQVYDKGQVLDDGGAAKDTSLPYQMYRNCAAFGALVINGNTHQYTRTCMLADVGNFNNGGPSVPNRVNREPGTQLEGHGAICPSAGNPAASDIVDQVTLTPGRTMVTVSSLAGNEWRDYYGTLRWPGPEPQDFYRHDGAGWWAAMLGNGRHCRNNCTTADLSEQDRSIDLPRLRGGDNLEAYGALFVTFNRDKDGNVNPYKAHGYFKSITLPGVVESKIKDEFEITYDPDAPSVLFPAPPLNPGQ